MGFRVREAVRRCFWNEDGWKRVKIAVGRTRTALERIGIALERIGIALARIRIALRRIGIAQQSIGVALERIGIASESIGIAVERIGIAPAGSHWQESVIFRISKTLKPEFLDVQPKLGHLGLPVIDLFLMKSLVTLLLEDQKGLLSIPADAGRTADHI